MSPPVASRDEFAGRNQRRPSRSRWMTLMENDRQEAVTGAQKRVDGTRIASLHLDRCNRSDRRPAGPDSGQNDFGEGSSRYVGGSARVSPDPITGFLGFFQGG